MHLVSSHLESTEQPFFPSLLLQLKAGVVAHFYFMNALAFVFPPLLMAPAKVPLLPYYRRERPSYLKLVVNND